MTLRALLIYIALLSPWQAWAGLSFHLAYYQDTLGSRHVSFPNDHLVCCVAIRRYLQSSELKSVYVFHSGDRVAVAIDIAPEAKEKINKIVNANLKSMSSHNLDKHIALGILVDGQPKVVIQGLFQPLLENRIIWWPSPSLTQKQAIAEVDEWIQLINDEIAANTAVKRDALKRAPYLQR